MVVLLVSFAGYRIWDKKTYVFDDAFISYRYADNLANGHGLVYNIGERVQGYTNFLWTVIAAGGIKLGLDPVKVTRAVGLGAHLFMLGLLAAFATWNWLGRGAWALALLPMLAVLVLPDAFALMAGSGLESPFVAVLLVLAGVVLWCGHLDRWTTRLALCVVLSLAALTRLDCVAATAAAAVALVVARWIESGLRRDVIIDAAWIAVPVAAIAAAYLVWTRVYYGEWLPNTYYAKAANRTHLREGFAYVTAFGRSYAQAVPLLLLSIVGAFLPGSERLRRVAIYVSLTVAAELAHIIRVGGDFMEYRFMWQLYGLLSLGGFASVAQIARSSHSAAFVLAITTLAVSFQEPFLEKEFGMQALDEMNNYATSGSEIGKRLGAVLPPDTILATTLAGSIAYYSKLTVIDQWGLNDRFVAHLPYTAKKLARGHVKAPPESYLKERGVNLYIRHPAVCSCISPCRENKPNIFVRLGGDRCLRSWYFEQKESLTRHVCDRTNDFILNKIDCPEGTKAHASAQRQSAKRKSPPVDSK